MAPYSPRPSSACPASGQLALQGTKTNDLPQVLAVVLITAVFVALCNLIVDLLYAVLDPRVRTG